MPSPERSWSPITTVSASVNFSRNRTSSMHVSSGFPHRHTSNHRGRGNDPVVVLGKIKSLVAVNIFFCSLGSLLFVQLHGYFSLHTISGSSISDSCHTTTTLPA